MVAAHRSHALGQLRQAQAGEAVAHRMPGCHVDEVVLHQRCRRIELRQAVARQVGMAGIKPDRKLGDAPRHQRLLHRIGQADGDVGLTLQQFAVGVGGDQLDADARVQGAQQYQQLWQHEVGQRHAGADAHQARQAGVLRRRAQAQLLRLGLHRPRRRQEALRGRRGLHALAAAHEQLAAQLPLQRGDLPADRGRIAAQLLCGCGDGATLGHQHEAADPVPGQSGQRVHVCGRMALRVG